MNRWTEKALAPLLDVAVKDDKLFCVEAELAVSASLNQNTKTTLKIATEREMDENCFCEEFYGDHFRVIKNLIDEGIEINFTVIKERLKDEGKYPNEYIDKMLWDLENFPTNLNPSQTTHAELEANINIVVGRHQQREGIKDNVKQIQHAFNGNGSFQIKKKWQDPIPFDDYSQLPRFPTEYFPPMAFELLEQVAKVNQVDAGLPASMYLSALSTCLAKKAVVNLDTHIEPVNLYTCPVLDSGERKTSTMRIIIYPIFEYQARKKSETLGDGEPPIFVVDDITTESLFTVMSENDERMAVISAEGGIFGIMAGKYNAKGFSNFDLYLKAHAGDSSSIHRIQRKAQYMHAPSLTMCLAVQRDVIMEIGRNEQFRRRGLLGRFLYSLCQPQAGYRKRQANTIPHDLLKWYREHIQGLMDIPLELQELKFTPEAQDAWDRFYNEIEVEMRQGGKMASMKDWGSKLAGAVARISGLLHFAKYGKEALSKSICVDIVDDSVAIGKYYRQHAMATFGLIGEDVQIESAKKILEYLKQHEINTLKGREVLRGKSALKTMDSVKIGLNYLILKNYIKEKESFVNSVNGFLTKGRPEATTYDVNPKIYIIKS